MGSASRLSANVSVALEIPMGWKLAENPTQGDLGTVFPHGRQINRNVMLPRCSSSEPTGARSVEEPAQEMGGFPVMWMQSVARLPFFSWTCLIWLVIYVYLCVIAQGFSDGFQFFPQQGPCSSDFGMARFGLRNSSAVMAGRYVPTGRSFCCLPDHPDEGEATGALT